MNITMKFALESYDTSRALYPVLVRGDVYGEHSIMGILDRLDDAIAAYDKAISIDSLFATP